MLAIRSGRGFDGEHETPGGVVVLVDGGRIAAVHPATAPLPDGVPVADFPDTTVLPGLIDMHVHLCGDSRDGALDRLPGLSTDELDGVLDDALRRQLSVGVTTVRDLGDRHWAVLERRGRAATNPVPTILASGPPVTSPRGHCWQMGGEADGPAQLRAAVAERADRGADVVNVMTSGGALTSGTDVLHCQFTLDDSRPRHRSPPARADWTGARAGFEPGTTQTYCSSTATHCTTSRPYAGPSPSCRSAAGPTSTRPQSATRGHSRRPEVVVDAACCAAARTRPL
ncbi:MAG: amidohydrolase family protein [Pseudonocardiaceae bacterium]|nr:amidohydrolase family protein [Pseudonocardiaceae bacterium]